ncbi:hypothetical protein HELRODRAFT_183309 [Helobdella robusta]|uniref:F-box domain-containing protein n=1 Tax=Helobdella robusta TaxID=6412 RepID=T1FJG0_HELRO|nr:hypothetical protein HELRODRAFT_183309 [Helobdella robusta]ESO11299.1 hypothetical protein HELRODRAFT_183309 [Helobdella robusta]
MEMGLQLEELEDLPLPDHLLIKIYSFLPRMRDKFRLSLTNRRLRDLFLSPQLWESFYVEFSSCHQDSLYRCKSCKGKLIRMSDSSQDDFYFSIFKGATPSLSSESKPQKLYKSHLCSHFQRVLTKYNRHVKSCSFLLGGYLDCGPLWKIGDYEKELFQTLQVAVKHCCSLENLEIGLGEWLSMHDSSINFSSVTEMDLIYKLISNNSKTLRSLSIISWPVRHEDGAPSILNSLPDLQKLSIFHPKIVDDTWIRLSASIPQPEYVFLSVQKLRNLTSLSLHCFCISAELLNELSLIKPKFNTKVYPHLTRLNILLIFEYQNRKFFDIPQEKWRTLHKTHQNLAMRLSIGNKIPYPSLFRFLEVVKCFDVESVIISQYCVYDVSLISTLAADFNRLKSFVDYTCGSADLCNLLSLVENSPLIDTLVYHGDIEDQCVLKLIAMRHWRKFEINMSNVIIKFPGQPFDPDSVLTKDETTGQYIQTAMYLEPGKGFNLTEDHQTYKKTVLNNIEKFAKSHLRQCVLGGDPCNRIW